MTKYLTNTYSVINVHKNTSTKSEVVTQLIYGDSFSVLKRFNKWFKIKIKEDNYLGFIQKKNFKTYLKPTHKINILKAKIYRFPNKRKKINELTFGSKLKITHKQSNFLKFDKGWIYQNEVKPVSYKEKDFFKKIIMFKNTKYKWGGKSFKGIDCSALIQVCLNFNNKYCPRDAKDQIKYFKKSIKLNNIKKNDIMFWKGHVAVALSKKKLIHAYGPMKKTVVMGINNANKRIKRTAKLELKDIKRIK